MYLINMEKGFDKVLRKMIDLTMQKETFVDVLAGAVNGLFDGTETRTS